MPTSDANLTAKAVDVLGYHAAEFLTTPPPRQLWDAIGRSSVPCQGGGREQWDTYHPDTNTSTLEVREACGHCPFVAECLQWAVHHEDTGVWGGTSPNVRRKLRTLLGVKLRTPTAISDDQIMTARRQSAKAAREVAERSERGNASQSRKRDARGHFIRNVTDVPLPEPVSKVA